MTENEAIKVLEKPTKHIKISILDGEESIYYSSDMVKAFETAIQALKEIQQYRAIGTVKQIRIREAQFKRLSEGYLNDLTSLREYQAIGTVEELKTMKENGAFTGVELAQILAMQMELKKYQSIGTIEEFKALKENRFFNFDSPVVSVDEKSYKKAIDKFTEEIRDWQIDIQDNEYDADKFDFVFERIYEIAEQLKGVKE